MFNGFWHRKFTTNYQQCKIFIKKRPPGRIRAACAERRDWGKIWREEKEQAWKRSRVNIACDGADLGSIARRLRLRCLKLQQAQMSRTRVEGRRYCYRCVAARMMPIERSHYPTFSYRRQIWPLRPYLHFQRSWRRRYVLTWEQTGCWGERNPEGRIPP